jgi:hypothetical protein
MPAAFISRKKRDAVLPRRPWSSSIDRDVSTSQRKSAVTVRVATMRRHSTSSRAPTRARPVPLVTSCRRTATPARTSSKRGSGAALTSSAPRPVVRSSAVVTSTTKRVAAEKPCAAVPGLSPTASRATRSRTTAAVVAALTTRNELRRRGIPSGVVPGRPTSTGVAPTAPRTRASHSPATVSRARPSVTVKSCTSAAVSSPGASLATRPPRPSPPRLTRGVLHPRSNANWSAPSGSATTVGSSRAYSGHNGSAGSASTTTGHTRAVPSAAVYGVAASRVYTPVASGVMRAVVSPVLVTRAIERVGALRTLHRNAPVTPSGALSTSARRAASTPTCARTRSGRQVGGVGGTSGGAPASSSG